jgi:hypothetical protein
MLPHIKHLAESLLLNRPDLADKLIARWLSHSEQYAQA